MCKENRERVRLYLVDLNRLYRGIVSAKSGVQNLARISKDPKLLKFLPMSMPKDHQSLLKILLNILLNQ